MITDHPFRSTAVALVVVLLLTVVGVAVLTGDPDDAPGSGTAVGARSRSGPPPAPPTPAALRPYTAGPESAPLHLVEYGDYRCPSCIDLAASEGVNRVLDRWTSSGRLRFTWRDDAFLGPGSVLAAQAARAAALQDHFFPVHFAMFGAAAHDRLPSTRAGFVALARRAHIPDARRFARDLASPSTRRFVRRSGALAAKRKVPYVPSFAVDGVLQKGDLSSGRRLERRLRKLYHRIDPDAPAVPPDPVDADPGALAGVVVPGARPAAGDRG